MKIDLRLVSPLEKIFPDEPPRGGYLRASALKNEVASFQAAWIAPGEALARFDAGLLKLVPPTISNLTSIVAATSVDEAWNAPFDGHVRPHPVARPCGEVVLGCEVSET